MQPTQQRYPQPAPYAPPIGIVASPVAAIGTERLNAVAPDPRTRYAAVSFIVCGALLLFGLISSAWFGGNVGLLGVDGKSWFDVAAPTELKLFSAIGIVGIVAALAFLIQSAVMLLMQQPQRVMMVPLNATLGVAAFGCFSFFFRLAFGRHALSYAGILTLAAIIAASVVIGTLVRPLARAST